MKKYEIKHITKSFGTIEWFPEAIGSIPGDGWFIVKVTPILKGSVLKGIVSDIENNKELDVYQGGMLGRTLNRLMVENGLYEITPEVEEILSNVSYTEFTIALHPGIESVYEGQPLAIPLNPEINFEKYPDHPHLNHGSWFQGKHGPYYLPESLCYTDDVPALGDNSIERIIKSLGIISIWLLRHMIWVETRKRFKVGTWIGLSAEAVPNKFYPYVLNPEGECRCSSGIKYKDCHRGNDLVEALEGIHERNIIYEQLLLSMLITNWNECRGNPHKGVINELRSIKKHKK